MLDEIEAQSEGKTSLSLVTHGNGSAAIVGPETFHNVAEIKQIMESIYFHEYYPSYSRALEALHTVCDAAEDTAVSGIDIYIIGDGWVGQGSLEDNSGYRELVREKENVRIWGFCLGYHSYFDENKCCLGILDGKCHHHTNDFDSSCILPLSNS